MYKLVFSWKISRITILLYSVHIAYIQLVSCRRLFQNTYRFPRRRGLCKYNIMYKLLFIHIARLLQWVKSNIGENQYRNNYLYFWKSSHTFCRSSSVSRPVRLSSKFFYVILIGALCSRIIYGAKSMCFSLNRAETKNTPLLYSEIISWWRNRACTPHRYTRQYSITIARPRTVCYLFVFFSHSGRASLQHQ